MPSRDELKQMALATIDRRSDEIIAIARAIERNPETGFNEHKTSRLVQDKFTELGIPFQSNLALTGVKGSIPCGGGPGPSVAVLGELDSLRVTDHVYADPDTGAAHACGHHAQIGMMLGATIGLLASGVTQHLAGRIVPFAVPAEEFIEVERRLQLRAKGKLEFLGGKQELIRLGAFDDVHMAMMVHTAADLGEKRFALGGTSNGHVVKFVQYAGRAAHAGGMPHMGINALNAAMFALQAIHANRETFRDHDTVRVHGVMNKGGDAVSAVPADVRLEWRVRSGTLDAVVQNSARVDRCFKAGALAVGARVKITNIPGYLPLRNDPTLQAIFQQNAAVLFGEEALVVHSPNRNRGGSTDMGDLSQIMPVCHPYTGGAAGTGHGKDYVVTDYQQAVVNSAKVLACAVIDLLADGATKAREVVAKARPPMTRAKYLEFQRARAEVLEYDGAQ